MTRRDPTPSATEASKPGDAVEGDGRGVLEGAFRILRALPDAGRDHQILELSRITGIPRPSVYRLLAQLRVVGAVERPRDHYVLAHSLFDIARRTEPLPGLRNQAVGVMQSLRAQTGATVSLVIPTEQGCSALDVIPGQRLCRPRSTRASPCRAAQPPLWYSIRPRHWSASTRQQAGPATMPEWFPI